MCAVPFRRTTPHLFVPAGDLGASDAVAYHGLGIGELASGAEHGVLPRGFQLPDFPSSDQAARSLPPSRRA